VVSTGVIYVQLSMRKLSHSETDAFYFLKIIIKEIVFSEFSHLTLSNDFIEKQFNTFTIFVRSQTE